MDNRENLINELELTRQEYLHLLESIPEDLYGRPSSNPAWTIGDALYHIALGPSAMQVEIWMILHVPWLFTALINNRTADILNWGNALFARHPKRITPEILIHAYEHGNNRLLKSLRKMRDGDLYKSIHYPEAMGTELSGVVTVEDLFHYIQHHLDIHASQIRERLG